MNDPSDKPIALLPRWRVAGCTVLAGVAFGAANTNTDGDLLLTTVLVELALLVLGGTLLAAHIFFAGGVRRTASGLFRTWTLVVLLVPSQIVGVALEGWTYHRRYAEAQRWCEDLSPRLEAWRERTGEYPDSLSVLTDLDPPALCRTNLHYKTDSTGYWLCLREWVYSSAIHAWRPADLSP